MPTWWMTLSETVVLVRISLVPMVSPLTADGFVHQVGQHDVGPHRQVMGFEDRRLEGQHRAPEREQQHAEIRTVSHSAEDSP